jgi:hypothetical protein
MQVAGNKMTSIEVLARALIGTLYGSEECMDGSEPGDVYIIEGKQETKPPASTLNFCAWKRGE